MSAGASAGGAGGDGGDGKGASRWASARTKTKGMMHAAAVLKTVPHGVESSTFLGSHIAREIKDAVPLMHDVAQSSFRRILQAVMTYLSDAAQGAEMATRLQDAAGDGAAIRNKTTVSTVQKDLTEMNVPADHVKDFCNALRTSRFVLEDAARENAPGFPSLDHLRWRVDVAISTSNLSRALQPSVMMEMTLSNGDIKTFEVPVDKFHELRYNVAKVLKEMKSVESHPVMRIAFDQERAKMDEAAE